VGFAAKGGAFANPGAWMDAPTFLRITDDRVELATLDGAATGGMRVMETLEKK
jgi:hypothetical protein